jgi:ribosomal protein S6--L-glutamate ligase
MIAALRARGHHVQVIDPEAASHRLNDERWLAAVDLIVARGRSWGLLCLLSWAEALGIPTVNHRVAIAAVHNKAEMAVSLASARVPIPLTLLGSPQSLARRAAAWSYPVILKPLFGDNGHGLQLVNSPHEMTTLAWSEPFALAQQFVSGSGNDLKVYVIGDEIWAVRKPSPLGRNTNGTSHEPAAEPVPAWPALRDLARRCGRLFGLQLYGIDCIETASGPVVIEVNEFPNYTAIPDADEKLADYVVSRHQWSKGACESGS